MDKLIEELEARLSKAEGWEVHHEREALKARGMAEALRGALADAKRIAEAPKAARG